MQRHRRARGWVLAAMLASVTIACGEADDTSSADGGLGVVTTVAPLTSIVASVVGDGAEVVGLVPEGAESHTFEPPPSAAEALSKADVIFVNGLGLDEPVRDLAEANRKDGSDLVALGDRTITPDQYIYDFSFPKEAGRPNPHLWTNPPMAKGYARVVADVMKQRDPANAGAYESRYQSFAAKVDELDRAMVSATATIPAPRRKLLTYHDAYAYFARQYGWTVIGAIQPSSFEEPTPKEVGDLVQQVKQEGVPAIFGSEVFPSPVLEQIGTSAGVRYVDVLRDDDLPGGPGDPEHSWLSLMRFDFVTMVESLGGDATTLRMLAVDQAGPDRARYPQ